LQTRESIYLFQYTISLLTGFWCRYSHSRILRSGVQSV